MANSFSVKVHKLRTKVDMELLEMVQMFPGATTIAIAEQFGWTKGYALERLNWLEAEGSVKGDRKKGRYIRWSAA